MTRTVAATYAAGQYVMLRSPLGIIGTDTPDGVGPALDQAFLSMGVSYPSLAAAVTDTEADLLLTALIRYYILDLCREAVALKVDLSLTDDGISKRYGQQADHLAKMQQSVGVEVERIRTTLEAAGVLDSGPMAEMGDLRLDIYEPCGPAGTPPAPVQEGDALRHVITAIIAPGEWGVYADVEDGPIPETARVIGFSSRGNLNPVLIRVEADRRRVYYDFPAEDPPMQAGDWVTFAY